MLMKLTTLVLFLSFLIYIQFCKADGTIYNIRNSGRAVINAAEMGTSFPLKRRDQMLDYILTLMGYDVADEGFNDSNLELLRTQVSFL